MSQRKENIMTLVVVVFIIPHFNKLIHQLFDQPTGVGVTTREGAAAGTAGQVNFSVASNKNDY